jgi:hypothetical protein
MRWRTRSSSHPNSASTESLKCARRFQKLLWRPRHAWQSLLTGIPDKDDRHVLAAAIAGHAHVIVTDNIKHFPVEFLAQFDILCHSADDFLIHQFHLNPFLVLEKLDGQAINIGLQRPDILATLKRVAPNFVALVEKI